MFWWDPRPLCATDNTKRFYQSFLNDPVLGIFQIERLKHFLSPEESLFEGSQGRFRSVSIRFDMEPDRDEFAIKSFLGIAVSVGQIWEDDRCKKMIVFSFDLDSFWLLLSLVTGWFFKGGEARIFEIVSYCEMLSWMISGFSTSGHPQIIVPVTTNSFQFRQSLFYSHQVLKRPLQQFLSLLLLRKLCRNCSKSLPFKSCWSKMSIYVVHTYMGTDPRVAGVISGSDILIVICEASLRHSWPRLPFFYDCISGISLRCNQRSMMHVSMMGTFLWHRSMNRSRRTCVF